MPQSRKTRLVAFFAAMAVVIATPLAVVASDRFTDVPISNVFHDDISWLADANVTRGCNPPANTEFCPGDNVTREQMSAFMRRFAQYIGAEDGTPAEADTVGGYEANALTRLAYAEDDGSGAPVITGTHLSTSITAPRPGYLHIAYLGLVGAAPAAEAWICAIGVDDDFPAAGLGVSEELDAGGIAIGDNCPAQVVYPVAGGTHVVEVEVASFSASAEFFQGTLTVQFVPFDAAGDVVLASSEGASTSFETHLRSFKEAAERALG